MKITITLTTILLLATQAYAELVFSSTATEEQKGLMVAKAADARDTGWQDWAADATMILRNSQGQSSNRSMRMKALEQDVEGDKRIIVFYEPRDVKGTALLVYSKKQGNDDQWLFLPALSRVKRIAANNKSGPFVGSEFAYEDLSSQEVEKYQHRLLRSEKLSGFDCFVVERIPVDKNSGYTRQIVWLDKEEFRQLKVEYYDRKGSILKTFTAGGYHSYGEGFWRADWFEVQNHQNGKSTRLEWSDYAFTQNLRESHFHRNALKNVR